ncbi:MAG: hypothetical protein GX094_00175 [Clostridiales bacterium]|jgi:vancomycin resistance protein YoaR|nr:hypothetical protein [Clostridiales bacterium]
MGEIYVKAAKVVPADSRPRKRRRLIVVLCIILPLLLGIGAYAGYEIKNRIEHQKWVQHMKAVVEVPTIYEGIWVDDVHLGGMSVEEAKQVLAERARESLEKIRFELIHNDKRWELTYKDVGAYIDWDKKISQAYGIAREGELEERYNRVMEIAANGIRLKTSLFYNMSLVKSKLEAIAQEINYDPVDADIKFYPDRENKFEIIEEKPGLKLDVESLYSDLVEKMKNEEYCQVVLSPEDVPAKITKAHLQKATYRIAQFSTSVATSTADRKHNVRLALSKVNGYRLDPGEVFSFNEVVGPRTAKRGFRSAPVIMPDKSLQDDYGGGVCQASSTIYNAALRADLEIVERYHHSFPIAYVPIGLDATVSYGGVDLKFRNNKDTPIFIRTFSSGNNVYVEIYGEKFPNNGYITCSSTVTSVVAAPAPKRILDKSGKYVKQPGGQVEHVKSRNGYKVTSYKTYYENGKKVWTKVIAHDYYRPIQGIIYYRP